MRTFIKLSKKLLVGIVSALAICMIIGSYQAVAAEKDDKYQAKNPNNLFGLVADFGLFANEAEINAHMDSNYAVKELINGSGADAPVNDTFYIGNHSRNHRGNQTGNLDGFHAKYFNRPQQKQLGIAKLYISGNMSATTNGNQWFISDDITKNQPTDGKDVVDIKAVNSDFIDFSDRFKELKQVANLLSIKANQNATYDLTGNKHNKTITCNAGQNVLNLKASEITYPNENVQVATYYPEYMAFQVKKGEPIYIKGIRKLILH